METKKGKTEMLSFENMITEQQQTVNIYCILQNVEHAL